MHAVIELLYDDIDDLKLEVRRKDKEIERLQQVQLCGHPIQAIYSSDEDTNHCRWCEEIGRAYESGRDLANEISEILHRTPEEIRRLEREEATLSDPTNEMKE